MNILYGVPGEGMGHATRSKVVIDFLLKEGHNVHAVSCDRAYQFLVKSYPGRVHEIKGFHFAYKDSEISKMRTFLLNFKTAPKNLLFNFAEYLKLKMDFHPDLVITDFESFAYYFAKLHRIPIISIDNMQVMDRCKLDIKISKEEKGNFRMAKAIVKAKVPGCDHYLISSFFNAAIRKKNTSIVPLIVRDGILNAKPSRQNHILVYQTTSTFAEINKIFQQLPDITFYVYGFNKDELCGNVIFKSFSEENFVNDLAGASAVIANGGYSFISEAIYLKKPIYSFPIKNQFEQLMNASYIDKMGYGKYSEELDINSLKDFLKHLDTFKENLSKYKQDGNKELFEVLKEKIKEVCS